MSQPHLIPVVFPTHVGMNRGEIATSSEAGDQVQLTVFPTHVGMNRRIPSRLQYANSEKRVPHARGDEPMEQ